jgi:hypothetical protein
VTPRQAARNQAATIPDKPYPSPKNALRNPFSPGLVSDDEWNSDDDKEDDTTKSTSEATPRTTHQRTASQTP